MEREAQIEQDLAHVREILAGSEAAWQDFVERYSPLLLSVQRRYLFDEDDARDAWADTLQKLREGRLEAYAGRARLSTWLVTVARTAAIDQLRHRRGRRRVPEGLEELPARDQFVYREIFQRGRTTEEVRLALSVRPELQGGSSFEEIIDRLEALVGDRAVQRVAWDLHASSVGQASGRLLEYMQHAVVEAEERQEELSPERQALHAQTRRTLEKVQSILEQLPSDEREILEMRFSRGWSAPRIQQELGLDRQREVYTRINRALRSVRRKLGLRLFFLFLAIAAHLFR